MTDKAIEDQNVDNNEVVIENEDIETTESIEEEPEPENEIKPEPEEEEPKELALEDLPLPGDEKENKKSDLPKWAEKRLSKKDREIQEARAQAESFRIENEKLKNSYVAPVSHTQNKNELPERDDFDSEAEYIAAIVDNRNQQMMNSLIAKKEQQDVIEKERSFLKTWTDSEETGLKKYPDFDEKFEVLNDKTFPANRMMAEAIIDSPYKDDILYFLGSNPEHARKLAQLNGIQATKKIAEIESRFAARKKKVPAKSAAIIEPVRGNKGTPAKVNPETIPQEDFDKWYKEKFKK